MNMNNFSNNISSGIKNVVKKATNVSNSFNNAIASNKIENTTSNIDVSKFIDEKRKYENLKSNINNMISYLNSAIENLDIPSKKIGSLFVINGVSIDSGKLSMVRDDLVQRKNYLSNNVLPEINKKIKQINESIG